MKKLKLNINYNGKFALIWSLVVAFTLAFFFTSNSPFFRYDSWADSSVYTQVGHSWIAHGLIPYKEVFDHKGPFHFLLFGIGSLLKIGNSYIGIYIIESLLMSLSIYYYFKTINLFIKSTKVSLLIATLIQLLMFATVNFPMPHSTMHKNVLLFEKGGSPEEFCLPFVAIIVYLSAKFAIINEIKFSKLEWMLFGLSCSVIFLEKFTLSIPFYLLFVVALAYTFFKNNKQFINGLIYGVISLLLPLIITILYFKLNGAFSEFIVYYFKVNIFNYSDGESISFIHKIYNAVTIGISMLSTNYILFAGFFISLFALLFTNKLNGISKLLFIYIFSSVYLIGMLPGREYPHYLLPVLPCVFVGFAFIVDSNFEKFISKDYLLKLFVVLFIVVSISITFANEQMYFAKINLGDKVTSMEKMANIIKKDKKFSENNTNVLVLFSNNTMIHTLTNTTPKTKFFYRPGMELPQYDEDMINEIKNKRPDYLVTFFGLYFIQKFNYSRPNIDTILSVVSNKQAREQYRKVFKNYKLIYRYNEKNPFDRRMDYLFKRK